MAPRTLLSGIASAIVFVALAFFVAPDRAYAACGDGILDAGETCDDGNLAGNDGCSNGCTLEPCPPNPAATCIDAGQAQLEANEKFPGKERLRVKWSKAAEATTLADFGDVITPSTARRVLMCLYDDQGTLLREFRVQENGHQTCPGFRFCWEGGAKSYHYGDVVGFDDGVTRIMFTSGGAGKGRASAVAGNDPHNQQPFMQTGTAAALTGNTSPTIQLITSNGFCLGATMNRVTSDDGVVYKAQKK